MNMKTPIDSLPTELIIKLIYYLDEKTLSDFIQISKYIYRYNFAKVLIPYKIIYNIDKSSKNRVLKWLNYKFYKDYDINSFNVYINDLSNALNKINKYNIDERIKLPSNIIYSIRDLKRHQCLIYPIDKATHKFRYDKKATDRRFIISNQHCILNINEITYKFLRKKHFDILALIY